MKYNILMIASLMIILFACKKEDGNNYDEDWESLKKVNEEPEWFKDSKLGIYTHWGPNSLACEGAGDRASGWYANAMYLDSADIHPRTGQPRLVNGVPSNSPSSSYLWHIEHFGSPDTFGYKDVIKAFNPSKFDAKEWAHYFALSGAQFAGNVAIHHDNFAMWDSEVTPWNIKNTRGVDVSGELKKELTKKNMKFIQTFHHAFAWRFFIPSYKFDGKNQKYEDLYGEVHGYDDPPTKKYQDRWYAILKEVIDKYQPDMIWFDWWRGELDEEYRMKFLAYYYNKGIEWGKEVAVCYKNESIPADVGVFDIERGRKKNISKRFWLTDTSTGPWFYRDNASKKSPNELIDVFVDIISKNGAMLLNVPPNPDGSLPQYVKETLTEIGKWNRINNEAVFGTRPWKMFGEGPTSIGHVKGFMESKKLDYTCEDIRYTQRGDSIIYAFVLGVPQDDIIMRAFNKHLKLTVSEVVSISLLGSNDPMVWEHLEEGIKIKKPQHIPNESAIAYKIVLNDQPGLGH